MRYDDELSFLLLYQLSDSVDTSSDDWLTVSRLVALSISSTLSSLRQSGLLRLLRLWSVLVKQLEQLSGYNGGDADLHNGSHKSEST